MLADINLDLISTPLSDDAPAGEDLRYTKVYDDIKEARRADDDIPQGEWQRDIKTSDWDKVVKLSQDALISKSKDFQIAAWLAEALAMEEGFSGAESGMRVITTILNTFWDTAYPLVEDDDFDYRIAPFEFLNDKLTAAVRQIPLTDSGTSQGYSYLKWKESRDVGYEADSRGNRRSGMIAEGKIPAEEFDSAVTKSSASFYKSLADAIADAMTAFNEMDAVIDEKFGVHAPRISELGQILDECNRIVVKICREQKGLGNAVVAGAEEAGGGGPIDADQTVEAVEQAEQASSGVQLFPYTAGGEGAQETVVWNEVVRIMQAGDFKGALNMLLAASGSQPSERGRSRYRLLVARLCLRAGRPDLAKPIVEQLYAMINDLHLENWESPIWIAEVMESLYQCLTSAEYVNDDPSRAQELFRRICTMDVTKALASRK